MKRPIDLAIKKRTVASNVGGKCEVCKPGFVERYLWRIKGRPKRPAWCAHAG